MRLVLNPPAAASDDLRPVECAGFLAGAVPGAVRTDNPERLTRAAGRIGDRGCAVCAGEVSGEGFRVQVVVAIVVAIFVDNDWDNDWDKDGRTTTIRTTMRSRL